MKSKHPLLDDLVQNKPNVIAALEHFMEAHAEDLHRQFYRKPVTIPWQTFATLIVVSLVGLEAVDNFKEQQK